MLPTESKQQYLAAFEKGRAHRKAEEPGWLNELREAGIGSFATLGFPTTKSEEWKYTNLEPIWSQPFVQANGEAKKANTDSILSGSLIDAEKNRLVFINGIYAPQLSRGEKLSSGARVNSLAQTLKRDESVLKTQLGQQARHRREPFVALNTAFMDDGAVVIVPAGCRLNEPIHLIFVSIAGERRIISQPRIFLFLGAGSEAKIVESYLGSNRGEYLCNAVTELIGGPDAVVDHYRVQQEGGQGMHVGTLAAVLNRGCQLTAHAITLSGALVRNNVRVVLDGEGAGCVFNGLYLIDGKEHVDNFTEIEHAKPRGSSLELYKGILSGAGHAVFNGKIVVHKDAQKTDARQTNKNLLLSPNAVVNTKPQLEIYADDVKCSHGSTIGQLDADALFYLRSRGLGAEEARSLLSFAFASEVVGRINIDSLRQRLDDYLAAKYRRN
ncbi:MAG TPA: Fe-S cluster assembly protein SufD [Candidatus Binatia bacterium]|nr:Fe-S cluster assembly protein SufD [Candidatus Binatia bacterium]